MLRFGDVEIDLDAFEIRRDGERVHVEPQVFDVVQYLVTHRDRMVSKEELLEQVWQTRFVSESALTSRIKTARRALGDNGRDQHVIQTVHGRGYRWVADVETDGGERTASAEPAAAQPHRRPALGRPPLPTSLTPFIGRRHELAAVLEAVRTHRLVTATGPGGTGKTRLALAAAAALADELPDGVAFADLVEVTEPSMVVAAIADAVGVAERSGANRRDALHAALASRECLVVVDNCEHLVDAVRASVGELLLACPDVRVLATSRIRLMLPYEHVYPVPGMSVDEDETGRADAVELFMARMAAAGSPTANDPLNREHVRALCTSLDGMALAIELAAARVPSLGLEGLVAALGSQLSLLTVGRAAEHRHQSLRAAIDWTYQLLDDEERATLRAASVFAAPFDVDALAAVRARPRARLLDVVARLVDWNLLARQIVPAGRFRVLETIRQFAAEQTDAAGEREELHTAHLAWARTVLDRLQDGDSSDEWCDEVDLVLPDARAALRWAIEAGIGDDVAGFAGLLAELCYERGLPGEAQHRFQDAAAAAPDAEGRHAALRFAAGAAAARNAGTEAIDLLRDAADAAVAAGRLDDAAIDLATAAMYCRRAPGIMGRPVPEDVTEAFLAEARAMSTGRPSAEAAIAGAAVWGPDSVARSLEGAQRAVALARAAGDPLIECAALDLLTAAKLDDLDGASEAVRERRELMARMRLDARAGFELYDTYHMSCQIELARGNFDAARRDADVISAMPFFREARHIGLGRLMEVDSMAGDFDAAVRHGELFERDWANAGRLAAGNLAVGCYALAMVHGIVGDDDRRARWVEIATTLLMSTKRYLLRAPGWGSTLDALLDLHRGEPDVALARLSATPDDEVAWANPNRRLWRPWYAAAWAEASVLVGVADGAHRLELAARAARGNLVAEVLVERAAVIADRGSGHDLDDLRAIARSLERAGARYQASRTHVLAGASPPA
jgi:predicted ATPase/DNA-binding winged helix-turn-helix (wHTH) protein